MTWLTRNLGWMIALAALLIGGAAGYGRVQQVCTQIEHKADRDDVLREMDLIHGQLMSIERKLDAVILDKQNKAR
jgi:hypothetical protein